MNSRELPFILRRWLESKVRIDAWDLDIPKNQPSRIDGRLYAANCAIAMPMENLLVERYSGTGSSGINASATFPFTILYRFTGSASMHQLPIPSIQALVEYLGTQLLQGFGTRQDCIDGSLDEIGFVRMVENEDPVKVGRTEGEDSDWLIVVSFGINAKWRSHFSPEDLEVLQPVELDPKIEVSGLDFGIHRSLPPVTQEPGTFVLDRQLVLEVTNGDNG